MSNLENTDTKVEEAQSSEATLGNLSDEQIAEYLHGIRLVQEGALIISRYHVNMGAILGNLLDMACRVEPNGEMSLMIKPGMPTASIPTGDFAGAPFQPRKPNQDDQPSLSYTTHGSTPPADLSEISPEVAEAIRRVRAQLDTPAEPNNQDDCTPSDVQPVVGQSE